MIDRKHANVAAAVELGRERGFRQDADITPGSPNASSADHEHRTDQTSVTLRGAHRLARRPQRPSKSRSEREGRQDWTGAASADHQATGQMNRLPK